MEPDLSRSGPLAQMVEHRTFNPLVAGSIPAGPTTSEGVQSRDFRGLEHPLVFNA